jgi:hypothetical protein
MVLHPLNFRPQLRSAAVLLGVLVMVFGLKPDAGATVIFSDTFTGPDNTALLGRMSSPIDVPGSTYAGNGNVSAVGGPTGGTPYEADLQSNRARIGSDAGVALDTGVGAPTVFDLSISFEISSAVQTQGSNARRGAGLGFFSSVAVGTGGSFHCYNNFTGLAVDNTGSVRLIVAGFDSGIATTVAGFDPGITHTLSYSVSTYAGVGSIFAILLDGTSVSLTAPVNTFTVARTALAGFYFSDGPPANLANFDDFFVATVPEPSSFAVLFGFVFAMCAGDFCLRRIRRTG